MDGSKRAPRRVLEPKNTHSPRNQRPSAGRAEEGGYLSDFACARFQPGGDEVHFLRASPCVCSRAIDRDTLG